MQTSYCDGFTSVDYRCFNEPRSENVVRDYCRSKTIYPLPFFDSIHQPPIGHCLNDATGRPSGSLPLPVSLAHPPLYRCSRAVWALIEKNTDGTATAYFFHDLGTTKNATPGYRYYQLKGRCAVVDSLDFEDEELAAFELEFNGFQELSKKPGPWDGSEPFGTFYDARETEEGIYSRGGYWKKMS